MKKLRIIFALALIAGLGIFSYKYIRKLIEFFKLIKTLPEYLRDIIGEKPVVHFTFSFSKLIIHVGLSKAVKEREKNLVEVIECYINDFYPDLTTAKIEITIFEKADEKKKNNEEE